jgi:hypothetical protein
MSDITVKKLLALAVIFIFCGQAFSATAFGLRGGVNLANATHGPDYDYQSDAKVGLILGGAFEAAISKRGNRRIRLEAAYVQKGWQNGGEAYGTEITQKAEIDEIVFTPAMLFVYSQYEKDWYILAGVDIGLNLKAKATTTTDGHRESADIPDWNSTNLGVDLGVGMLYPMGRGELLSELRLNFGLTDMYKGDNWDPKTNGVQLIFGYNFSVPTMK